MQLEPHRYKSKMIAAFGFGGNVRDTLRIQFKDPEGNLTSLGDYLDVPRSLALAFEQTNRPDQLLNEQIKPYFKWVRLNGESK